MAVNVSNEYKEIIYSQDDRNDIKISFNGVELEDAGYYVEKVSCKSRILPDDGNNRFSLDNFISKEIEIILHNVPLENIVDQVEIEIGTLVNNTYEYVPLGVFNIQDTPTTNNNKTTLKLRDNRVKFDFGYNAKPLMDSNNGKATYKQMLNDICNLAGIVNDIESFDNEDYETGYIDNTIQANVYVSYLLEQAGLMPIITREGHLNAVDLNESTVWRIPLSIVSNNYEIENSYSIKRIVYESGVIKFETSNDETLSTLFINSANPFIINQEQVDNILEKFEDFAIDSVRMSEGILGNPAIDPYDIIEVYNDYELEEPVVFRTLANCDYSFNGKHKQTFTTIIGTEERTENVTLKSPEAEKKYAKTEIDNINASIKLQAERTTQVQDNLNNLQNDINENYYTKSVIEQMIIDAENGVTNTFSEAGGNNILRNTDFSSREVLNLGQTYEYWYGNAIRNANTSASNGYSIILQNNALYQEQNTSNGTYTLSFMYRKLNPLATVKVIINGAEYELTETTYSLFQTGINNINPILINTNTIRVEFQSDLVNSCEIYDIMLNIGTIKLAYSQNANEVRTDTVNISRGITITSSASEVKFTANNDGIRTKTLQGQDITTFTDTGMTTKEAVIENQAKIVGILRQKVGDQVWDSLI